MDEAKTVGTPDDMSLYVEQMNDVSNMRSALLSFPKTDSQAAIKAIHNVTLLRVYHQVERIVRYTEMCDKIEDRMYQSINAKLDNTSADDESLWYSLLAIQDKLQKIMIESHKLLEPYLNIEQLQALEVPQKADPADSFTSMILDQESREKVRTSAQQVLAAISMLDSMPTEQQQQELSAVQNKAQEALASLQNTDGESING